MAGPFTYTTVYIVPNTLHTIEIFKTIIHGIRNIIVTCTKWMPIFWSIIPTQCCQIYSV